MTSSVKHLRWYFLKKHSTAEYRYSWLTRTYNKKVAIRGGSRTAATFKMDRFVIIVNGFQPLTIIRKRSILDVAAVLDPLLAIILLKTATAYALVLDYYQD